MKKICCLYIVFIMLIFVLTGCSFEKQQGMDKINIVTTNFSEYDWARNIIGQSDKFELTMLGNGVDMHSFQPSASDIITISDCDLFVYVGGESDEWVTDVLSDKINDNMEIISLMQILGEKAIQETYTEGMQIETAEAEEDEEEYDEHVWLSLKNSVIFCENIELSIERLDPENKDVYKSNLEAYNNKIIDLDKQYTDVVNNAKRRVLLFGDRFPFRYLTDDYGLEYYAVFSGCSAETEASFETITFMSNKADELSLNYIMTIDGSDKKIAETIIQNTKSKSQKILTLNSMQSVNAADIENGETYLKVMENNLSVLSEALK